MTRLAFISIIILSLCSCAHKPALDDLKKQITEELGKTKGEFAVAFNDLSTGEVLLMNEHQLFHAASTMKAPVMAEVYKQAAEGKLSLNDSILIKNEFKSIADSSTFILTAKEDSDTLIYSHIGEKRTLSSLVYDMIIWSSNLATNMVIEKVGAKKVTQTMRSIGAKDMQVLRGVEDGKAFKAGMNNQVTAYDLMLLFEKIGKEEMVNAEASKAMISILLDQKFNDIIPAQLPADVKVAHKTGWITGLHHDAAIVFLPDGRKYVLVLLSAELEDETAGVKSMATVSKMIYEYVKSLKTV
jgi:beta-lactamase class A